MAQHNEIGTYLYKEHQNVEKLTFCVTFPQMSSCSTAQPPLPTAEEQSEYYYGLQARPKLVARSNAEVPWQLTYDMNHPVPKGLEPVGSSHPLGAKIDADGSALRKKLHECLETVDWDSLNVLRIGTTTPRPVVLFIGVNPGTLALRDGFEVAMACRRVLVDAGLPDVHCEIYEAKIINYATSVAPFDLCLSAQEKCRKPLLSLASTIGQSIASDRSPMREGSLGLFLELVESAGQTPKKMALVSAHAVLKGEEDQIRGFEGSGVADRPLVLMPGDRTLEDMTNEVDRVLPYYQDQTQQPQDLISVRSHLGALKPTPQRELGSLFYSRPVRAKRIEGDFDSLLDYALVELNAARFGREFPTLANMVYTEKPSSKIKNQLCYDPIHDHDRLLGDKGRVRLQGTVPVEQLKYPYPGCDTTELIVGKMGKKSGLT